MPVFSVKIGSRRLNKPESFVEVVEATTIDFSCVRPGPAEKTAALTIAVNASIGFRNISADIGTSRKGALIFLKRTGVRMSAFGPKRTLGPTLHTFLLRTHLLGF